jgi:hypothetical protein
MIQHGLQAEVSQGIIQWAEDIDQIYSLLFLLLFSTADRIFC